MNQFDIITEMILTKKTAREFGELFMRFTQTRQGHDYTLLDLHHLRFLQ